MNVILYLGLLILELLFLSGLAAYSVGLLYSSIMGAPYVPTSKKHIDEILKKANLKKGQIFMELGSGDGRIVRRATQVYGVKGIGVDINSLLILLSKLLASRQRLTNVTFLNKNIFNVDFSIADSIYMFLMPETIKKILPKMEKEINKGALVISHGFKITGWEKKMTHMIKSEPFSTFYYKI